MKKACVSAVNHMGVVTLLSVGLIEEDHASLEGILKCSQCGLRPICQWKLNACPTLASALAALRKVRVPVVVCESDLQPGTWKEVLEELRPLPEPPVRGVPHPTLMRISCSAFFSASGVSFCPDNMRPISRVWAAASSSSTTATVRPFG